MNINKLKWIPTAVGLLLLFSFAGRTNEIRNEKSIVIKSKTVAITFDAGTGSLLALTDVRNGTEMLDGSNNGLRSPWEILLEKNGAVQNLDIGKAKTFQFIKTGDKTATLQWSDFFNIPEPSFKVTVIVNTDGDDQFSRWHITISGVQGYKMSKVSFPKIANIKDMGNEELAVPQWMGELIKSPRGAAGSNPKNYSWSYPGPLSMQFVALYNKDKSGFYAAADDTLSYVKHFGISVDDGRNLSYRMDNFPPYDSTIQSYTLPYHAVVGVFKGDWQDVAMIYRDWGTKQKWCRESRFKNATDFSWANETALWIWNRGRSGNVLTPAEDLKNRLGLPVNVLWHWWHGCAYDDGFPEYFPPREGEELFKRAVLEAAKKDINAIVYMNSYQWGTSTKSFEREGASRWAVRDINGDTKAHVFNIFTRHSLTPMCMATDYWRHKYASLADKAINEYNLGGIYMDQACLNLMCYNRKHGHSHGGGNYWSNSFGLLAEEIRSGNMYDRNITLAGEGGGEGWLPYLNVFLTLAVSKERYAGVGGAATIPLFQAVYHPYAITFGSYSSLVTPPYDELWPEKDRPATTEQLLDAQFNEQFLMEQARSFVWGMQPTIANYHETLSSARSEAINYLLDIAKTRYKNLKYLLHGTFMPAPDIQIPEKTIPISRLSIYAGQKEKVTAFQLKVPLMYASAWKAEDGSVGIALASISSSDLPVRFTMETNKYGLPSSGKIYLVNAREKKLLQTFQNGIIKMNYILPAKELGLLEITSEVQNN